MERWWTTGIISPLKTRYLSIWINEVHTKIQRSVQPQAEFLTGLQNSPQGKIKYSNDNRRETSISFQGVNQIWPSSKDISDSKINLEESRFFKTE